MSAPRKGRLLLVEDDPTTAKALSAILQRRGWEVTVARTISAAVSSLRTSYNWVILDLMLPDGDGETILEQLAFAGRASRVIITTGCNDDVRLRALRGLQPAAVFHKPIDLAHLCQLMESGSKDC